MTATFGNLNYDDILKEVALFAKQYKEKNSLPPIPSEQDTKHISLIVKHNFDPIVKDIEEYFESVDADINNSLEHALWVARLAGYISEKEAERHALSQLQKDLIIKNTILAGLLHDIERHLGCGMSHAVEGEKTARKILKENRLLDENILLTVLHHDEFEYKPDKSNVELKIIFGSVYDIDKLRYGTEREKDFWLMEQRKGIAPEEAIHDYNFLFPILDSWHTHFGKKVCRQYLVYALEISKYIESKFS